MAPKLDSLKGIGEDVPEGKPPSGKGEAPDPSGELQKMLAKLSEGTEGEGAPMPGEPDGESPLDRIKKEMEKRAKLGDKQGEPKQGEQERERDEREQGEPKQKPKRTPKQKPEGERKGQNKKPRSFFIWQCAHCGTVDVDCVDVERGNLEAMTPPACPEGGEDEPPMQIVELVKKEEDR